VTSAMRPYSAYRSVALPIATEVPAHWGLRRLRTTTQSVRNGIWGNDPGGEHDFPCVRVADFSRYEYRVRMDRPTIRSVTPAERQTRMLRPGDLLLEKSGGGDQQPVGAVMLYDHPIPAVCSNFVARVRPAPGFDSRYLVYLHAFLYSVRVNVRSIKQTTGIQNLDSDSYFNELVPLAPSQEQKAIAQYLDVQSARDTALIRNKRRLIALLNEEKQAIIQQAVMRGLDLDVPLKPSGVEWLGEIPAHWEFLPFLRCVSERADYRGATPEKVDSGIQLITARNIRTGWIDYESSKEFVRIEEYQRIMRRGLPRVNDIVFTMEAPLGNAALVNREDIALAQRVVRFRMNEQKMLPEFALLSLLAPYFQTQLRLRATGSTASGIKASKLPQLLVACPPAQEQGQIVERVAVGQGQIDQAIQRVQRELDLIREYRTRLIADVVTGQLDVREAAASLPDLEIEDSVEPLAEVDGVVEDGGLTEEDEQLVLGEDKTFAPSMN
jgi:type I restriction enzyme, S subunit